MDATHSASMSSELRNKNLKRKNSSDYETNKQLCSTAKNPKTNLQLKLIDVSDDCLQKIFTHLTLKDLVNIVECDGQFISACKAVFSKNFRKEWIKVSNKLDPKKEAIPWSVKLLNHFGEMIVKLDVEYFTKYHRFSQLLDDAIIDNCRKTVSKIKIKNPDFFTMNGLKEPFEFVTEVKVSKGCICDLIEQFGLWFPKATTLELKNFKGVSDECSYTYHNFFWTEFPTLQQFGISNCDVTCTGNCFEKINVEQLYTFFEENPQLKSLYVEETELCEKCNESSGIELDYEFLNSIDKYLPNLEKLHLSFKTGDSEYLVPVEFKKLKELSISYKHKVNNIRALNIDVLNVCGDSLVLCADIISMNNQVKVVNLSCPSYAWKTRGDVVNMIKVVSTLPQLYELKFPFDEEFMKLQQVIELLTSCKKLVKLVLLYWTKAELDRHFNNAIKMAKAGWKVSQKIEDENSGSMNYEYNYSLLFEKIM